MGGLIVQFRREDFIGSHSTKTYAVAIDPPGKCRWDSNMVSTEHVIEVLTETVSTAYLKHLRDRQVSYIFDGKTSIDLKVALAKLRKVFGITKVRIDGGGVVWGSFLKACLIDEISHIVVPVAEGSIWTTDCVRCGARPHQAQSQSAPVEVNQAISRRRSLDAIPGQEVEWLNMGTRNMSIWSKDERGRFAFPEGRRAMRCKRCKIKTTGNCSYG